MTVKKEEEKSEVKTEVKEEPMETESKVMERSNSPLLVGAMREELHEMQIENKRLHNMVTDLHQRHHQHTLKVRSGRQVLKDIHVTLVHVLALIQN